MNKNNDQKIDSPGHNSWEKASGKTRLITAVIAVVLWAVVIASWYIVPSEQGYGSHTQLRIPKCSWIVEKDCPCPTCGMTTAYSLAAHGRVIKSFITQPAGCIFALCHFALTGLLSYISITGRYPYYFTAIVNYYAYRILFTIIAITLLGWGWTWLRYKGHI